MKLGRLVLRTTVGLLFVGHGTQKLFGWFGGGGLEKTGEAFDSMGLRPGRLNAVVAGGAEAAGGLMLAAGFATPVATAALSSVQITAIRKVHAPRGIWVSEGGYEYNAVLLAVLFALTEAGPGPLSLDAALGSERSGIRWALAELGAGALASTIAIAVSERGLLEGTGAEERTQAEPVPAEAAAH